MAKPTYYFGNHYSPYAATYRGGMNKLYEYLNKNIIYPKAAIANHIDGIVTLEFSIDDLGRPRIF